jgi:cobalt-precorrin-6B (C15)-methyltransferase
VDLRLAEAPDGLPDDADALFLRGQPQLRGRPRPRGRNRRRPRGDERLQAGVAGEATAAFRERGLLDEVVQFQVSHGYELAGATSFDSDNPVYMLVGGTGSDPGAAE